MALGAIHLPLTLITRVSDIIQMLGKCSLVQLQERSCVRRAYRAEVAKSPKDIARSKEQ